METKVHGIENLAILIWNQQTIKYSLWLVALVKGKMLGSCLTNFWLWPPPYLVYNKNRKLFSLLIHTYQPESDHVEGRLVCSTNKPIDMGIASRRRSNKQSLASVCDLILRCTSSLKYALKLWREILICHKFIIKKIFTFTLQAYCTAITKQLKFYAKTSNASDSSHFAEKAPSSSPKIGGSTPSQTLARSQFMC